MKLTLTLRPRNKRACDIDNYIKATLDALENAGIYGNDFQVDHLEMIRGEPIKDGAIHIMIETLDAPPEVRASDEPPTSPDVSASAQS